MRSSSTIEAARDLVRLAARTTKDPNLETKFHATADILNWVMGNSPTHFETVIASLSDRPFQELKTRLDNK